MWSNIVNEGQGLQWVVSAMRDSTAIWITNGSFNLNVAPLVSGAGWILYCMKAKCKLYDSSLSALLGLDLIKVSF